VEQLSAKFPNNVLADVDDLPPLDLRDQVTSVGTLYRWQVNEVDGSLSPVGQIVSSQEELQLFIAVLNENLHFLHRNSGHKEETEFNVHDISDPVVEEAVQEPTVALAQVALHLLVLHRVIVVCQQLRAQQEWVRQDTRTQQKNLLPCDYCDKLFSESELKACSKCNVRRYCGRDCQVSHWKAGHKSECKLFRSFQF
jgi:hypothetical protein